MHVPDVVMAAGEKRPSGEQPAAKRRPTEGANSQPIRNADAKLSTIVRTGHKDTTDHLAAIGLHKIAINRAASRSVQHACLHNPSTDGGTCAPVELGFPFS